MTVPDLVVAGAGMAGLCAAAEARARGADVVVVEKGDRAGGAMLLSSRRGLAPPPLRRLPRGVPRRAAGAPAALFDRLDAELAWLEALGARVTERGTGNPARRACASTPRALTAALVARRGRRRCGAPLRELPADTPVVLATGGFAASRALVREHVTPEADALLLRAHAVERGRRPAARRSRRARDERGLDEFYGRTMPAPPARIESATSSGSRSSTRGTRR